MSQVDDVREQLEKLLTHYDTFQPTMKGRVVHVNLTRAQVEAFAPAEDGAHRYRGYVLNPVKKPRKRK